MSKYTIQLKNLIDNDYDFGLSDYPIHDENYRPILNKKILDHYKFREIGFETPALFKHYLNTKMNEIMPYYKKLYESTLIEYNPLHEKNIVENGTNTNEQSSSTNVNAENESSTTVNSRNNSSATNTNIESDTPQGVITVSDVSNGLHASKVIHNANNSENTDIDTSNGTSSTSSESNNELTNNNEYFKQIVGNSTNPSELIKKYRETFLNIDLMIINELNDLFFGLY